MQDLKNVAGGLFACSLMVTAGTSAVTAVATKTSDLLWVSAALLTVLLVILVRGHRHEQAWRRALAHRRQGEHGLNAEQAFGLFAGHPDLASCDPKVVRVVHDKLQALVSARGAPIPLKATDELVKDLRIDLDLEDLVRPLEATTGRKNGWQPGQPPVVINTVSDFVRFWSSLPRA